MRTKIALTIYNDYLIDFLFVMLQSFNDAYKTPPNMELYYCNVSSEHINAIKAMAPYVNLKEVPEFIGMANEKSTRQRLARKVEIWRKQLIDIDAEKIIFMDIDMLVLKPFEHFFSDDIDFAYTYKNPGKKYRRDINAGVMFVKKNKYTIEFFNKMVDYVLEACSDQKRVIEMKPIWGGAEQAFIGEYINEINKKTKSTIKKWSTIDQEYLGNYVTNINHGDIFEKDGMRIKGFHIDLFNAARCEKIKKETHVLHYVGGWRFLFTNMDEDFAESRKQKYLHKYKDMRKLWEGKLKKWKTLYRKKKN